MMLGGINCALDIQECSGVSIHYIYYFSPPPSFSILDLVGRPLAEAE